MNQITIDANAGKSTISRHIYGHFAEHLGHCIYGGFWVDEQSPLSNTRGIRDDIVAALRAIRIPNLRWPGGCFADEYHWQDGIGPRDQRPSMVNTHWGGVTENNHFGTHEFMDLCEQLGCEPYICGNVGSGTVREMQQWVEYLTLDGQSPMTALRQANGREAPWRLRYWGVGNESWGCGGSMRAEYYADEFRRYATYCRNHGTNRLYKIACGPNAADYHWTAVLMREAGRYMDGLSLHYYTVPGTWAAKGSATDFDEQAWFVTLQKALFMEELIARHSAVMDRFDPDRRVGLIVDEWGAWYDVEPGTPSGFLYQQNTLRDALVAGLTLNSLNRHCQRVHMANLAQTVNVLQAVLLADANSLVLTPTYHVFEMYKIHQDATLLPLELRCDDYACGKQTMPSLNASASRDGQGHVHLTLCHVNPNQDVEVLCNVSGMTVAAARGRVLTAEHMTTYNTVDAPDRVRPIQLLVATVAGNQFTITVPAMSVIVLELEGPSGRG
jgi:alpha-N-arabinofuranosidase